MLYPEKFADSHLHAYAPFDRGFRNLSALAAQDVTDANLLAYTYIETGIDNNLVCLYYKEKCRDVRLRTFGGLYYDAGVSNRTMPYKEQAELLLEMGCDGIKFLDMKPNYNLYCGCSMDDPVYDEMYDMLEKRAVPLVTHIADPACFWHRDQLPPGALERGWCYDDPKFLTQQQIFDSLLRRLEKNPQLRMSIAHFGFMSCRPELVRDIFDRFPNVTFDLAPAWEIFADFAQDIGTWKEIFTQYSTRILYGTDTSTGVSEAHVAALHRTMTEFVSRGPDEEFPIPHYARANMRGLGLDETAQRNISHDNYFRFVGDEIRPLNRPLIREHAALIRSIAAGNGDAAMTAVIDTITADL